MEKGAEAEGVEAVAEREAEEEEEAREGETAEGLTCPKWRSASSTRASCSTPAAATTSRSGRYHIPLNSFNTSGVMTSSRSSGHSNGLPSVLPLYAVSCSSSGRIMSGLLLISPTSHSAASRWMSTSSWVICGLRIVSERMDMTEGRESV